MFGAAFNRHTKIAFQFSGGKDSTAALLLLRPYWDRLTVYFCDSGDAMPETLEAVGRVEAMVPYFSRIKGYSIETRDRFGQVSDLIPWSSFQSSRAGDSVHTPLMIDRLSCCLNSIMVPMHQRMLDDGVTLIIRGQKRADDFKGYLSSGDVVDGIEYLYPVQDWTSDECFAYIAKEGFILPRYYHEGSKQSMDCATCTAWLEDKRTDYLKQYHPELFGVYKHNLEVIRDSIAPSLGFLLTELDALEN